MRINISNEFSVVQVKASPCNADNEHYGNYSQVVEFDRTPPDTPSKTHVDISDLFHH